MTSAQYIFSSYCCLTSYSVLLLCCTDAHTWVLIKSFVFVLHFGVHAQEEANFEVSTLLRFDCKNILNLLLLHLSTHHNRVLVGVKMLAEMNQTATEQKVLLNQGTNEEIVSCNNKVFFFLL